MGCHVAKIVNHSEYSIYSDAGVDLQEATCTITVWLNVLGFCHVIAWLAMYTNKQLNSLPNKFAGIIYVLGSETIASNPRKSGWGHFQGLFLPLLLWMDAAPGHHHLTCRSPTSVEPGPDSEPSIPLRTGLMWKLKLPLLWSRSLCPIRLGKDTDWAVIRDMWLFHGNLIR